jgi:hypothetical protein
MSYVELNVGLTCLFAGSRTRRNYTQPLHGWPDEVITDHALHGLGFIRIQLRECMIAGVVARKQVPYFLCYALLWIPLVRQNNQTMNVPAQVHRLINNIKE